LESIKRGLEISGYRNLKLLTDPVEAVQLVAGGEPFDIALLDITMSGMNGLELLERIKAFSPNTACIMLTAVNEISVVEECIQKGAHDYLVKPFSSEELVLRIERALEK